MREILFRGQTRRHGERVTMAGTPLPSNWVYGGIFPQNKDGDFAIIYQQEPEIKKFPVYADTVGQYTGLTDKNGKRIFEGDIVRAYDRREQIDFCGWVNFNDGGFGITSKPPKSIAHITRYDWLVYDAEVIGNIYDNPELLGWKECDDNG